MDLINRYERARDKEKICLFLQYPYMRNTFRKIDLINMNAIEKEKICNIYNIEKERCRKMEIGKHWEAIKEIFEEAYKSCSHFAVATVNEDGSPHVTPIGALILRDNQTGFYFEENPVKMPRNLKHNSRVCILAVNADKLFWGKALIEGKFITPPAVRLLGTAGPLRKATTEEIEMWQEKIAIVKGTKGYKLLWEKFGRVRDITFDSFEPVLAGEMTNGLWD
ncbi:MAG TPA: pyridoxamine 5'-phosphate oxidase family protein [Paludibacter sp.]|jgi:predicted pyridoxine 5'-phosphate oxidase superfamily flavin-nucleotide-binding protein|nr:pyridoxamine 5'-phosphate oxidase family protein [Paludibacter sp.]HQK28367.1 pyridoxamine 5'-phosphate oxidase family protein [Smithellaceae bacterium]